MKLGIITYYWPPAGGPGVQRWLKLSKYLAREGVQLYVVTVDAEKATYPLRDEGLLQDVASCIQVFRTGT
ncbi:glycosyl transferase family 1, partial [Schleiferiaceae bacterium]|nr:glycosyl transferase family 1 [Schleiferiaceae bacterium]